MRFKEVKVKACGTKKCSCMQGEESNLETYGPTKGGWMQVKVDV